MSLSSPARRRVPAALALTTVTVLAAVASPLLAAAPLSSAAVPAAAVPAAAVPAADVPAAALIDADTTWTYLEDDSDPNHGGTEPLAWTTAGADTTGWKTGTGSFGAKSGAIGDLGGGFRPDTLLRHYINGTSAPTVRTYFFRATFDLEAGVADQVEQLVGDVDYDDGVRIFLNGERVAGFHDSAVPAETPRMYAGSNLSAPQTATFEIPGDKLRDGTNTLAVALYQATSGSSDVYFDLDNLLAQETQPPAPPTRVVLTPAGDTATTQAVSWLAGNASDTGGSMEIRASAGGETRTVPAYSSGAVVGNAREHFTAYAEGLTPATSYDYRVGTPAAWSEWKTFTTADPGAQDWQFIYYGDAQTGLDSTWPEVVRQSRATAPEAMGSVHAGDLINDANVDTQWSNWFTGMADAAAEHNVLAAPGNHESYGDPQLTTWKAHFEYPFNNPSRQNIGDLARRAQGSSDVAKQYAAYYDFWASSAAETIYYSDYQGVRFVTLNASGPGWNSALVTPPNLPACSGAECPSTKLADAWAEFQAAWLDGVLADKPGRWSVVTFHQPVYSASTGRDEPVLRKWWVPVFERNDVDLVLMGHDHVYARGFNNADATETPGLTSGPVYVVSNSGAKDYDLDRSEQNVWTNNGATRVKVGENISTYGVVDVTGDTMRYRSYLAVKRTGASSDLPIGSVFDEFTVTRKGEEKYVTEPGVEVPSGGPTDGPTTGPTTAPTGPTTTVPTTEPTTSGPTAALAFAAQPLPTAVATAGTSVVLRGNATVSPAAPISYQWQRLGDGGWADLPGETFSTLVIDPVTGKDNGARLRLVATSGGQSVASQPSVLQVARASSWVAGWFERLERGTKPVLRVQTSVPGQVRVTLQRKGYREVKTVQVTRGDARVRLPRRLPATGRQAVKVTLRFVPADGEVNEVARDRFKRRPAA